jgi:hypothetical protein
MWNMLKRTILVLLTSILSLNGFSQKKAIDVQQINLENYPEIKGKLWVRDPDGIKTESVRFFEDDRVVPVSFGGFERPDSIQQNKAVLFLILNTPDQNEMKWYQGVVKETIKQALKQGDKYAIATFSCKENDRFVFPQRLNFTDNDKILSRQLDSVKFLPRSRLYKGKSQVYLAINEALLMLEEQNFDVPTSIVVLSNDKNMQPVEFQGENPVQRSKKLDIPVYGIMHSNAAPSFDIEDLCRQTYGIYFKDPKNEITKVSSQLTEYLNGMNARSSGIYYPFTYKTTFEKDGLSHSVKIDSKEDQTVFAFDAPKKSLMEWANDNIALSISIVVLFLAVIIIIVVLYRKNKRRALELEQHKMEQIAEMERHQQAAEQKLSAQEAELNEIRERERLERQEEEERKRKEQQEKEDAVQFQKMLNKGNLPWFEFKVVDQSGRYEIASPRLTVGRDNSSDWVIPHPTVSRKHFELTFKDYVYRIRDLGSSNGLIVNGYPVKETELKHGDVIQAGELILTFHI